MIQINGHLLWRAPAEKVNRHRHWYVNNVAWLSIVIFVRFSGTWGALTLFPVNFTLFSIEIKDILGCAELYTQFLGSTTNRPFFLIDQKNQLLSFLIYFPTTSNEMSSYVFFSLTGESVELMGFFNYYNKYIKWR